MEFKRIKVGSITETLMRAMEHADQMDGVLVLYTNSEGEESAGGCFTDGEMKIETVNWMIDNFKRWLLS